MVAYYICFFFYVKSAFSQLRGAQFAIITDTINKGRLFLFDCSTNFQLLDNVDWLQASFHQIKRGALRNYARGVVHRNAHKRNAARMDNLVLRRNLVHGASE